VKHTTRSELLPEGGILRVELLLRLLFSIQVIQVPKELIETVYCRKKFIAITKAVLAELTTGVPERLQ
jgi:hypothetical protein